MYRQSCHNQKLLKTDLVDIFYGIVVFKRNLLLLSVSLSHACLTRAGRAKRSASVFSVGPRGDLCHHMTGHVTHTHTRSRLYTDKTTFNMIVSFAPLLSRYIVCVCARTLDYFLNFYFYKKHLVAVKHVKYVSFVFC